MSLVSIPRLAARMGVPRRTLFRKLLRLADATSDWLVRDGRCYRVNLERLELAHPQRFPPRPPDERLDELELRVDELEGRVAQVERSQSAPAPRATSGHFGPRRAP